MWKKKTMCIHLKLREQRGGKCYKVMTCPNIAGYSGQKKWDDLLTKNGKTPEKRLTEE